MHSCLPEIIAGIGVGDAESLLGAHELLRAHRVGTVGTGVVEPYDSIYATEPLSTDDVGALRSALIAYVKGGHGHGLPSAVGAIRQLNDASLVPLLRGQLELHLRRLLEESRAVGQLVVTLGDLGEAPLGGNFSMMNIDENVNKAIQYLHRHGASVDR